jgi:hypothetical protein
VEDALWDALGELARKDGRVPAFIGEIGRRRGQEGRRKTSLSAAIRLAY